jgi:hypothetical protein
MGRRFRVIRGYGDDCAMKLVGSRFLHAAIRITVKAASVFRLQIEVRACVSNKRAFWIMSFGTAGGGGSIIA